VTELLGLDVVASARGVDCRDGLDGLPALELAANGFLTVLESLGLGADRLASRFSNAPKSVLPTSSSDRRPDSFSNVSILPNRFSRPSMYLALRGTIFHQICMMSH
jgi:hypothetical protein